MNPAQISSSSTKLLARELCVLLVEDNPADARLIQAMMDEAVQSGVTQLKFRLVHVSRLEAGLEAVKNGGVDIVLLDLSLPDSHGLETYQRVFDTSPAIPILVLTGLDDERLGLKTIKEGAQDYLVKGQIDGYRLMRSISYSIERKRSENELEQYREHLEELVAQRTKELENSHQKLRQAERMASIGALAAGIAHEINNPIGAILLTAQNGLIQSEGLPEAEGTNRILRKIINNAVRCGQIIKSVLQFSRQETTDKWPGDVNEVIQRSVKLVREYLQNKGGTIDLKLGEGMGQMMLNPVELEQVFVNLIQNAIESGAGSDVNVTIQSRRVDENLRVTLSDNGRGIAPEHIPHVFDPFYTTRLQEGGSGLGLSVVHGIVAAHMGTIEIQSSVGSGTSIILEFPALAE